MIRGIHHVALHTTNFDRMRFFYEEAFGFTPVADEIRWSDNAEVDALMGLRGSQARTVMLSAGTCYLELFEFAAPAPRGQGALKASDYGYTHFCVDVTDIEAEMTRLMAAGMTFTRATAGDMGVLKFVYGRDPDGNLIEIQEMAKDGPFRLDSLPQTPTRA